MSAKLQSLGSAHSVQSDAFEDRLFVEAYHPLVRFDALRPHLERFMAGPPKGGLVGAYFIISQTPSRYALFLKTKPDTVRKFCIDAQVPPTDELSFACCGHYFTKISHLLAYFMQQPIADDQRLVQVYPLTHTADNTSAGGLSSSSSLSSAPLSESSGGAARISKKRSQGDDRRMLFGILSNQKHRDLFADFMKSQHSLENLIFLEMVAQHMKKVNLLRSLADINTAGTEGLGPIEYAVGRDDDPLTSSQKRKPALSALSSLGLSASLRSSIARRSLVHSKPSSLSAQSEEVPFANLLRATYSYSMHIYNTCIDSVGPMQVNIPSKILNSIQTNLTDKWRHALLREIEYDALGSAGAASSETSSDSATALQSFETTGASAAELATCPVLHASYEILELPSTLKVYDIASIFDDAYEHVLDLVRVSILPSFLTHLKKLGIDTASIGLKI